MTWSLALLVSLAAALHVPGTHKRPIRVAPGLEVTVLEADEGKPGGVHTGTVTWSSARALAAHLSERLELVRGKRVVEIGCGCGLVSLTCCALGADAVLATDVEDDALARVAGAPGGAELSTAFFDIFGDAPLPACDVLVASEIGYTEKLALGLARRAAEAVAVGATVVIADSCKLRWSEFLAEASRLSGRDVQSFNWRDKSKPYVRPASLAVLRPFMIGSRPSKLAMAQAEKVRSALNVSSAIIAIDASGDIEGSEEDAPLARKGVDFTRSLDDALLDGTIDVAVHSCKDIPPQNRWREGLAIAACLLRASVEDVLIGPYASLDALPHGARVGSASMRRQSQLLARRPDVQAINIRGNVQARLAALDAGEVDALILAKAGLDRLAESRADIYPIPLSEMLPGAAQGIIAVVCRDDDASTKATLHKIDDREARLCVTAERALLDVVDASLRRNWPGRPPVAAYCCGNVLRGLLATPDGSEVVDVSEDLRDGESFEEHGLRAGRALVEKCGSEFLSGY